MAVQRLDKRRARPAQLVHLVHALAPHFEREIAAGCAPVAVHRGDDREGQEDQLGALGLVVNALVLWNTRYIALALEQLRTEGSDVRDEDVERLSPLAHWYINVQGRYYFGVPEEVQRGELRPLRHPEDEFNEL